MMDKPQGLAQLVESPLLITSPIGRSQGQFSLTPFGLGLASLADEL